MIPLVHRSWSNWLGDLTSSDRYRALPETLADLKELMEFSAISQRCISKR
jgi:hypothetical protein